MMRMRRTLAASVVLLLATASLGAAEAPASGSPGTPRVAHVEVTGHESLSSREVAGIVVPHRDEPFDPSALPGRADALLARLAELGHPFARVDVGWTDEPSGVRVVVSLDEGPPVRLAEVVFDGARSLDVSTFLPSMEERRGATLTRQALERDLDALLSAYGELGRPFAAATPSRAILSEDGVVLHVAVDEGPETRFAGLSVVGNTVTKKYVLERESGVVTGELWSDERVASVRPRLERLGIFASVSDPSVTLDPLSGEATIGVRVEEGTANRVSGVLGYAPSPGKDEGGVSGRLEVSLRNIAGTGRNASAEWARVRSGESRISFSYLEPWILSAPIDIEIAGGQTVRDTLYTTTEADLSVSARMGERTRVTWSLGGERYVPGGAGLSTTTSTRTSMAARFDGTDAPANPTRGGVLGGTITYTAKEEADGGKRNRSGTFSTEGEAYASLRPRHVLAVEARLSGIASTEDDVPFYEELVLGGAGSLRGYREEQFRGTRTALGTLEYRYILGRRSRAIAFVDVGYYYRGGSDFAKGTKAGYGIGLRADTRLGILSLDYGLGEGDGLLDGKLHVGLVREF
jgi:outer membrane protein insertion porin family